MFKKKPQKYFIAWTIDNTPDSDIMEFSDLTIEKAKNRIIVGENARTGEMYESHEVIITSINKL